MFSIIEGRNLATSAIEVEAVPTKWINFEQSTYQWPLKSIATKKLIRSASADPKSSWTSHNYDKILGVYSKRLLF